MGPKKGKAKVTASKKNQEKKKEQIIGDKTFGLKNKNKSKSVQQYIQQVNHQVRSSADASKKKVELSRKKQKEAMKEQMSALFKAAIVQPKVPPGTDPKSILCEFFKQDCCQKGLRCKFSHDLTVGKKAAKIDLYFDARDAQKKADQIDQWDQSKLETVIDEKAGESGKPSNQTDIVCKYFLDAIEKSLYGWFWTCPNGGKECKYRHALPPGYVFQTKAEREAARRNKREEISIEEIIEQQRATLGAQGATPVTEITLAKWKEDKKKRKAAELEKKRKEEAKRSGGRGLNILSGRALFSYDPSLFRDDDEADDAHYDVKPANEMEDHDELDDDDELDAPLHASSLDEQIEGKLVLS